MTDDERESNPEEPYEPPKVEDLQAGDGPSVTAAGGTLPTGVE